MTKKQNSPDQKVKEAEDASKNYEAAIEELQDILDNLQDGNVNVDELAEKVRRSSDLINYCQEKIGDAEMQVSEIVQSIEKDIDTKDIAANGDSENNI